MSLTVSGGPMQRTLSRIKEKNNIDEQIPLSELFPGSFMKEHTRFTSIEELFEDSGFPYPNEIAQIDEEELNGHIFIMTDFDSWEEMLLAAAGEYGAKEKKSG